VAERRSVYIAGFSHVNPIPAGCRFGNFLVTGVIVGKDAVTHELPASLEEQCANVFAHMRAIVEAAGGGTRNIVKVTVWHNGILDDPAQRAVLNRAWIAMFPDENSRPARHAVRAQIDPGQHFVCDMMAIFDDGPA
jgi:enamine deaminase RidA (YjgF/YER057c/UK114 family)